MMKKTIICAAVLATVIIAGGCSSVETSANFNGMAPVVADASGVAHIYSKIPGLYFFGLPVVTGAIANPKAVSFFKDNCCVDKAFSQMNLAAGELGAQGVVNASSEITSYPLLFPFFSWRVAEVSGTAVSN